MTSRGCTRDYKKWLEELAPFDPSPERYHHNRTGEDNADAHHKRQIMGREVVVAITDGKLDFGPWEQIFYGEFDGRRPQAGAGQGHRRMMFGLAQSVPPLDGMTAVIFASLFGFLRRLSFFFLLGRATESLCR